MNRSSILQKLETELTVAGKARRTVESYVACARDFIAHAGVNGSRLGSEHLARFLEHLSEKRCVAPSTVVRAYDLRHRCARDS